MAVKRPKINRQFCEEILLRLIRKTIYFIKSCENLSVAANRLKAIAVTFVLIPILMIPQCEAVNKPNMKTMKLVWLYSSPITRGVINEMTR